MAVKQPSKLTPQGRVLCRTLMQFLRDHPRVVVGTLTRGYDFGDETIEALLDNFDRTLRQRSEAEPLDARDALFG